MNREQRSQLKDRKISVRFLNLAILYFLSFAVGNNISRLSCYYSMLNCLIVCVTFSANRLCYGSRYVSRVRGVPEHVTQLHLRVHAGVCR